MPTHQTGSEGRDHNPYGFTAWMAGAGVKGGFSYGATDEFGYKAEQDVCTIYDFTRRCCICSALTTSG